MKSFKEYVNEVEVNAVFKNSEYFKQEVLPNFNHPINDTDYKILGVYPGLNLKICRMDYSGDTTYFALDPRTKKATIAVRGKLKNGVLSNLYLAAKNNNKLPAEDFYHYLIKNYLKALETDSQSEGAIKVWQKLSKKRDVNIHGWYNGKAVNIKFGEDDTHADYDDEFDSKGTRRSIFKMSLVAHIK